MLLPADFFLLLFDPLLLAAPDLRFTSYASINDTLRLLPPDLCDC